MQRAKHPRVFERLLIKERRKPRFTKTGARFILRVQRAKHPRAFEHLLIKERRKPRFTKDWRTFYFASAKLLNILDIPPQNSQNLHFFLGFRAKEPKQDFF